ncbi:MAG: hypothetical protein AAB597_02190 [Patescibacteria group bacterium]
MTLTLVGSVLLCLSLMMIFAGFPKQIWNQYKTQACGISLVVVIPALGVFVTRAVYVGIKDQDWFIMIPDVFGAVFSFVLLLQYLKYRNKPPVSK